MNARNLKFLLVVTARNVAPYVPQLVAALASQTEPDWRAVFIDDASTDDTKHCLIKQLEAHGLSDRFEIWSNPQRQYKALNAYRAINKHGDENDIIVMHDGDDWLADQQALSRLRAEHEAGWEVVWSGWRGSDGCRGNSHYLSPLLPPRWQPWVSSHLFSFRKPLFDAIEPQDLQHESGRWVHEACDAAIAWPVMEQTLRRKFLPEVLYTYNRENPLSNDRQGEKWRKIASLTQARTAMSLRRRQRKPRRADRAFFFAHLGEFTRASFMNLAVIRRYGWLLSDAWHFRNDTIEPPVTPQLEER